MENKRLLTEADAELRRKAEEEVSGMPENHDTLSPLKTEEMLHELRVHQVELSMQNEALRQAQTETDTAWRKYFDLYDRAPVGYFTISEKGMILEANLTAATLLGVPKNAMIQKPLSKFIFSEDQELYYVHIIQLFKTGGLQRCDLRMVKQNGVMVWVHLEAVVAPHDWGCKMESPVYRLVITDITERKQAENKLRESEEQFRNMVWDMQVGVLLQGSKAEILLSNPKALELLGISEDQLLGKTSFDPDWNVIHEDGSPFPGDTHPVPMAIASRQPVLGVIMGVYRPAEGERVWLFVDAEPQLNGDGTVRQVVCSFIDITDRKKAEDALRKSTERYELVLDGSYGGIWDWDVQNRRVNFSSRWKSIRGFTVDEISDSETEWSSRIHPDDIERVMSSVQKHFAGKTDVFNEEYRTCCKDGSYKWIIDRGKALRDDAGQVIRMAGSETDITERKLAEVEKERLEAQLHQAQKMESIGRLAGGIAHDFNNMLMVILGNAEMSLEGIEPDNLLHDNLMEIHNAAKRSADLTRQLLAFARKQSVAPVELNLNETVERMLKMLKRLIGEDIELVWIPGHNLWPVKIDPSQIDQILANLCTNARDAIAGVGQVVIELKNSSIDKLYCSMHMGAVVGDYVLLSFSDNGCGMDKGILSNIFEPFFTTKELGKGTGLGLATIYGIVKQNLGFSNVQSESGKGTTFNIYLPRYQGKSLNILKEENTESISHGHETILLVDDELAILIMGKRLLERLGYNVLAAESSEKARHMAMEYTDDIHLLMTDVIMPEMNGKDLAKNIQTIYPKIKILFMSGYTADVIAHQGILEEGVHFIQKPFAIKDLATKVREVMVDQI